MRGRPRNLAKIIALFGIALFGIAVVGVSSLVRTAHAADAPPPDDVFFAAISTNPGALENLLAERFVYRTSRGSTIGKKALIDELRSGRTRVSGPQITESSSTTQGDTTVSIGTVTLRAISGDGEQIIRSRFTHVWVKQRNRWQLLFRESTIF